MEFDAIKEKASKRPKNRKDKKLAKQINKVNQVYPIAGITAEGFIKSKVGFTEVFFEILDVQKYDLYMMDDNEFNFVTENNWNFHKQVSFPIKKVYMNFPEENQLQQEYFKHKIETSTSPIQINVLNNELEKLKHIERNYETRDCYLFIFAKNSDELNKRIDVVKRFDNFLGTKKMSIEKKKKILFRLNNHNTRG
ncbi:hypothetical protein [Cytobacillus kochii]|uniref:hypothetical protein n=1 Tax=Cytobacillus kochii TaxID=859143 RepID=UPI001CD654AA|nr:hypothetical protein [Cytobacillus kochii]MCA1028837.1 hypothetical protein [Cytobacillus kochii]